jgi:hypothetical protein
VAVLFAPDPEPRRDEEGHERTEPGIDPAATNLRRRSLWWIPKTKESTDRREETFHESTDLGP